MIYNLLMKHGSEGKQRIIAFLVSAFLAFFSFEGFVTTTKNEMYMLGGLAGAAVVLFFVFFRKSYFDFDTFLFTCFFLVCWVSGIIAYGVSTSFFFSQFFCAWISFFALYYLAGATRDNEKVFRVSAFVFSVTVLCICIFVLFVATKAMVTDAEASSSILGRIKGGRLCAFGNANTFGFTCTAFLMVSIFGLLLSKGILRIYYSFCIFVGWFCLGLTGSRTSAIGVSVSLGIFIFSLGIKKYCIGEKDYMIIRYVAVFLISGLAAALATESFALPTVIYRNILSAFTGRDFYIDTRTVHEQSGTITDRSLIWIATVRSLFRNPRRLLLGISSLSNERVGQAYEGHHENYANHSHNIFLEIARGNGIIALFIWSVLLIRWAGNCIKGVFNSEMKTSFRYMAACAAGIMIMGLTEPVPVVFGSSCPLTMTFFIICGYYAGLKRSDK